MVQTPEKTILLEEFLKLPETKPASEYINGQILQKPMPQGKHSGLQGELVSNINLVTRPGKIARAFPELRCTFGERSIVPDVAVFSWQRIPRDTDGSIANVFLAAPDWTIEILSPEQSQTRVIRNILHCLQHGTQMGWLLDPDEQMILVYAPNQQPALFEKPEDLLPVPAMLSNLKLSLREIFGWLQN